MNNVIFIGRLCNKIELKEGDNTVITLAKTRSYKNEEGIYETDFIDCYAKGNVAKQLECYCEKGDLIAVRGKLESQDVENNDIKYRTVVVAVESVSFLTTKKDTDITISEQDK
jgi:single-strand DNA-binding protein